MEVSAVVLGGPRLVVFMYKSCDNPPHQAWFSLLVTGSFDPRLQRPQRHLDTAAEGQEHQVRSQILNCVTES